MAHVALLQKYEKAPAEVEVVKKGNEDAAFWTLWGLSADSEPKYKVNPEWDSWFADIEVAEKTRPKEKPMVYTMGKTKLAVVKEDEELQKLREAKPRLYTYPNATEFVTVFDYEDLAEGSMICLCVKNKSKIYMWKGIDFEGPTEDEISKFVAQVKENCWSDESGVSVEQSLQTQESQSASFLEYFD